MLKELLINNFAIINEVSIEFQDNMTTMTGETGAGKSIIIDALGLLTGGRGSLEFIKTGTDKAIIQGLFDISNNYKTQEILKNKGINFEDGMLILKREFSINGRNVCRANGELINLSVLAEIGRTLVNIHGQNQSQAILNEENHIKILDSFASDELKSKLNKYSNQFLEYKNLKQKLKNIQKNSREIAQRIDMLNFQISEIEDAKLLENEEDELFNKREQLINFDKIVSSLQDSHNQLSGMIVDSTGSVMQELSAAAEFDNDVENVSKIVASAYYELQDATSTIQNILDSLDYDPVKLDEIQKRILLIQNLEQKYGSTINEVLKFMESSKKELKNIEENILNPIVVEEKLNLVESRLKNLSSEIHAIREKTAISLSSNIKKQLNDLYMDKTEFKVKIKNTDFFNEDGTDDVVFELKTNPGEDFKSLVKIASGGELSRIMLALEVIMSKNLNISTIVFDEIDTGVSGRVAQAIADKMYLIGKDIQVLCITHLPQVAAMSNTQLYIKKTATEDSTSTAVYKLDDDERVEIIAQMLAGTRVTDLSRNNAKELLDLAHKEQLKLLN